MNLKTALAAAWRGLSAAWAPAEPQQQPLPVPDDIMPTIPRANTHLTCVVIGERVADWLRAAR